MTTKALLFDLDGTLLPMDFDTQFMPPYAKLIVKTFARTHPGLDVLGPLMQATPIMMKNDGSRTNMEALRVALAPNLKADYDDVVAAFEVLYRDAFAALGASIAPDPDAARVVRESRARGFRTVLATNPIFIRPAIDARVRWAGLSPGDFDVVTSIHDCRYCKPHPGYYRALAETLGVAPSECWMIGNDVEADLRPAASIGMKTALVESAYVLTGAAPFSADWRGSLGALVDFIGAL